MDYEEIIEAIRQAGGGLSRDTAERAAQATLQTLAERLPRVEARHILQELPAAPRRGPPGHRAVLETLAGRIAGGQVEDLMAQLDPLPHPPLRQGMASVMPGARRMSLEDWLRQVAAREGAGAVEKALFSQVFGHARAVLGTLSEAVSRKEWFDMAVDCPRITGPSCGPASPDPAVRGRWWVRRACWPAFSG
jgi:uncharacterized protein (DUF2267 family)